MNYLSTNLGSHQPQQQSLNYGQLQYGSMNGTIQQQYHNNHNQSGSLNMNLNMNINMNINNNNSKNNNSNNNNSSSNSNRLDSWK